MTLPGGRRTMTSSGQPSTASALGNITNVIVLMFENRSFDHLLGAMPGVTGVLDPQGLVYPGLYNTMNPLKPACGKAGPNYNPASLPAPIIPMLGNENNTDNEYFVSKGNAYNHSFSEAMLRDLYAPNTTGIIGGQPQPAAPPTYPPTNSG